jgi:hypothetical protein
MPYKLEPSVADKAKAIVVNTKTGRHYSLSPIPLKRAEAQMRLLESLEKRPKK